MAQVSEGSPVLSGSRLERAFSPGRAAFVAYITAGDPDLPRSLAIARALERAGVDVLEFGVPFSDPLADGTVNQAAAQRALEAGATLRGLFAMISEFRATSDLPVVLFTYLNPVYVYGFERFHADAAAAGADGILILDLPPDEAAQNIEFSRSYALASIRLIAPTTPAARMAEIVRAAEGFVYFVSREGVTGEQVQLSSTIGAQVEALREMTSVPIAVGFGISTPEQAATVARLADGVVVGSAIVRRVAENAAEVDLPERIEAAIRPMVEAVHGARLQS